LERHKKKKKKKKKLRRGIPLSASVCCSLWMMHILEPPLTPVGNQVGQEIKKEKNEEKKREFRNVEQDKWAFFFLFFWWRQLVWPVNNASSTALHFSVSFLSFQFYVSLLHGSPCWSLNCHMDAVRVYLSNYMVRKYVVRQRK
jgi:hypothetical protein